MKRYYFTQKELVLNFSSVLAKTESEAWEKIKNHDSKVDLDGLEGLEGYEIKLDNVRETSATTK